MRAMLARAPFSAFERLLDAASRLMSGADAGPSDDLVAYALRVRPAACGAQRVFGSWLRRVQQIPSTEALANAAAVQRWEFAAALDELGQLEAPAEAERIHARLLKALRDAARGSQLLANGYRSTTYGAVCDGQALLADAHKELGLVVGQLAEWTPIEQPIERAVPIHLRQRRAS